MEHTAEHIDLGKDVLQVPNIKKLYFLKYVSTHVLHHHFFTTQQINQHSTEVGTAAPCPDGYEFWFKHQLL